jgi:hypothetical protein
MVWSPVAGGQIRCRPVRWLPSEQKVLEHVKKILTEVTSAINFSSSLRDWSPVAGGQIQCRPVRWLPSAALVPGHLKILKTTDPI